MRTLTTDTLARQIVTGTQELPTDPAALAANLAELLATILDKLPCPRSCAGCRWPNRTTGCVRQDTKARLRSIARTARPGLTRCEP